MKYDSEGRAHISILDTFHPLDMEWINKVIKKYGKENELDSQKACLAYIHQMDFETFKGFSEKFFDALNYVNELDPYINGKRYFKDGSIG